MKSRGASAPAVSYPTCMAADSPNLIWVDCEMTGLDLNKDVLVEIAVLVTDSQLNVHEFLRPVRGHVQG